MTATVRELGSSAKVLDFADAGTFRFSLDGLLGIGFSHNDQPGNGQCCGCADGNALHNVAAHHGAVTATQDSAHCEGLGCVYEIPHPGSLAPGHNPFNAGPNANWASRISGVGGCGA